MKKTCILFVFALMSIQMIAQEAYQFSTSYNLSVGYIQPWQRSSNTTMMDFYEHGVALAFQVYFNLPYRLAIQSGVQYQLAYGRTEQHWGSVSTVETTPQYIRHRVLEQNVNIPVYLRYTQPLYKKFSMFFFTGPSFQIGVHQKDYVDATNISVATLGYLQSIGVKTDPYERYTQNELSRFCLTYDLGGGFTLDKYSIEAGYRFGLNNIAKKQGQLLNEWAWFVGVVINF